MSFDKEDFFQRQIEECRELEKHAVTAEDRTFWRQTADRWREQLRQAQAQSRDRRRHPQRRRAFNDENAEATEAQRQEAGTVSRDAG